MSNEINNYLKKLHDKTKLNKILSDDQTDVSLKIDLYTGEYKGASLKFIKDSKEVKLDTESKKIIVKDGKKTIENLDQLLALAIDYEVVSDFRPNKVDDDHFRDLRETIEAELEEVSSYQSQKIYNETKKKLHEIVEKDYDKKLIKDIIKYFKISEKGDHLILERYYGNTRIKYNSGKDKLTIKNDYKYKEKVKPKELDKDFNSGLFMDVVYDLYKKKLYEEKRMDIDDGLAESFNPYANAGIMKLEKDVDLDQD